MLSILVKEYKSKKTIGEQDKYLRKHVVTNYLSYAEKLSSAYNIVKSTMEEQVGDTGKTVFKMNTPQRFFLTIINIINKYTDIKYEDNDVVDMFDELNKNGIVDALLIPTETEDSPIPQKEYNEFNRVLAMTVDDYMENNRSITGFLETKIAALGLSLDTIFTSLNELANLQNSEENVLQFPVDNKVD